MDYLKGTEFPPRADFVSVMRGGEGISQEEYDRCKTVYGDKCLDLWDYMQVYNEADVEDFAKACVKVLDFWRGHGWCHLFSPTRLELIILLLLRS